MFRGMISFYMVFIGIGYFGCDRFTTGEFWTIMMISVTGFGIITYLSDILKEIKDNDKSKGE